MKRFNLKKAIISTVIILLGSLQNLCAQVNIKGTVVNKENGNPIFGALVEIGSVRTVTNGNGQFEMAAPASFPFQIIVSSMGYSNGAFEIQSAREIEENFFVELESLDPEVLSTVVVTAARYDQRQEDLSVSLSVLKPNIIQGRNSTDGRELLEMVPGVHITDGQLNIRNGSGWTYGAGTRVQVLLDDVPLISPDAGQVQWDLLPLEAIGQVEVLKGSSSALFGTSALNGVVQFRTIKPSVKPTTEVSLFQFVYDNPPRPKLKWWNGWQSNTGLRWLHSFKKGDHNVVLSGFGQRDQGYKFDEHDDQARVNWSYEYEGGSNVSIGMNGGILWSENGESLLWNSEEEGYVALDSSVTITNGVDVYLDPYVEWRSEKHFNKVKARYMRVENNARNLTNVFDNSSHQYQLQYNHQFYSGGWILSGGVFSLYSESESMLFGGFHTTATLAAYGQAERKWKNGNASVGLRYESQWVDQESYSRPVMRLGVNQQVSPTTYLRASFGQGFRFPSIAELYTATNIGAIYVYPNPDLEPETGFTGEFGARQLFKFGAFNAYADAAFYLMQFDNMMEFSFSNWGSIPQNFLGVGFKSINIGPAQISGVELEIGVERKWDKWKLQLLGGVNFSNPIALDPTKPFAIDSAGSPITYRNSSSDTANDILKYRYTRIIRLDAELSSKKWTFGISVRNNDYMQNIDQIFESQLVEFLVPGIGIENARERLNRDDWLLDTRVYYHFNDQWSAGFLIENLLNYEIMSRPAELEAPRRFTLSVQFRT